MDSVIPFYYTPEQYNDIHYRFARLGKLYMNERKALKLQAEHATCALSKLASPFCRKLCKKKLYRDGMILCTVRGLMDDETNYTRQLIIDLCYIHTLMDDDDINKPSVLELIGNLID